MLLLCVFGWVMTNYTMVSMGRQFRALDETVRLVEIPNTTLHQALLSGTAVFKGREGGGGGGGGGDESGHVVLCTSSSTYSVTKIETSNTILLVEPPSKPRQLSNDGGSGNDDDGDDGGLTLGTTSTRMGTSVCASVNHHLELTLCHPPVAAELRRLLSPSMYKGIEYEHRQTTTMMSKETLFDAVLASPAEITAGMRQVHAFVFNGFVRLLHPILINELLDFFFLTVAEHELDLKRIHIASVVSFLPQFDPQVVAFFLAEVCSEPATESTPVGVVSISSMYVILTRARHMLLAHETWQCSEFMSKWRKAVPTIWASDLQISLLAQHALAIIESPTSSGGGGGNDDRGAIKRFFVESLSNDVKERFRQLFKTKSKWEDADIRPYLRDLVATTSTNTHPTAEEVAAEAAASKTKMDALLVKYTRKVVSPQGGKTFYCSRD